MHWQNKPTITIIIATYNKSNTLNYAIQSVLWQTFTDFECWVIGDACTDDSETVVSSFKDSRLHWHNLPQNSGYQSVPTNEALRRAQGHYIAYLNHDDIWLPNHLQVLVDCIEREKADFAYSIMEWIRENGRHADIPHYPDAPRPPEVPAILHHFAVVEEIGYWKEPHEIRTDPRVDFLRRAQFANKKFVLAPHLTVLKFDRSADGYSAASQQEEYIDRIVQDPMFAETELAGLLAEAYWKLEAPLTTGRLRFQLLQSIRKIMVQHDLEPDDLMPWKKSGYRIRDWRRSHGLDT